MYGFVNDNPNGLIDAFGLEISLPNKTEENEINAAICGLASHDIPSIQREALDLNGRHYMIDTSLSTKGKNDTKYTGGYTKPNGSVGNTIFLSPDLFVQDSNDPSFKSYATLYSQDGKSSFRSIVADAMIHENAHLCNRNVNAPFWMRDNVHDWIDSYVERIFRILAQNTAQHSPPVKYDWPK